MLKQQKVSRDLINNCMNMFYPIIKKEDLFNKMNDLEIYNYCSKETGFHPTDGEMAVFILDVIKRLRFIYSDENRKDIFETVLKGLT